ncbi:hypothetical protein ACOSQ4_021122 [Xanthoceras sorbifolium]
MHLIWLLSGGVRSSEGTSSFVRKVLSQPRRWCRDFLTEFQEAGSASVRQLLGVALRNHSWRPLDANMFKINYDVVVCLTGSIVGIGVVIKDSSEAMMLSASKTIEADYSPSLAKDVAVRISMLLAADSGLLPAIMESDSLSVINLIHDGVPIRSELAW